MPTPLRLDGLLAKIEGSYGTDATPTISANGVRIAERLWASLTPRHEFANMRDDVASGSIIPAKRNAPQGRIVEVEFPWEVKGSGSAYAASTDVECDPLMQACGLSVAVDTTGGSEKITLTPADTGHASCTIWGYAGGDLYRLVGCRGNVVWPVSAGEDGRLRFRMIGLLTNAPSTTSLPSIVYDSSAPPAAVGMGLTINPGASWTPDFESLEFDLGNTVEIIPDANGSDGLQGIEIPERVPTLSITVRKDALASYNPHTLLEAVTSHEIDMTLGSSQYNRLKLDVDEAYLAGDPEQVEYRGFAGYRLDFRVHDFSLIWD